MKFLLLILIINLFSIFTFADGKFDKRLEKLVLRAKVLETKIDRTDEKYQRVNLKIETTFTNEGNEPIIILQPVQKYNRLENFIFSDISLYGNDQNYNNWISVGMALPSVCLGCNENLARLLDQKIPPDNFTKILKHNDSFSMGENYNFAMSLKTSSGIYGWDEIERNNWKIVGRITYSMFPINLGKYGENFGHKLQKRWQKYGVLYVGADTHSLITSEKFEIDLTDLKFQ